MDEQLTGGKVPSPGTDGVQTPKSDTDAFAKRLKAVREKDRAELAMALGFESWDAAINSGLDKKLLDAGIEPSVGKPIIEDAVANHPDVIRARQIAAQAEQDKQAAELQLLNQEYGLSLDSVDALDAPVKELIGKGLSLSQAYAAIHYKEMTSKQTQDPAKLAKSQLDQSLKHMGGVPGNGAAAPTSATTITTADVEAVKRFMPNATQEQIAKFLEAHPEIKK